jgi:hypothetical protein
MVNYLSLDSLTVGNPNKIEPQVRKKIHFNNKYFCLSSDFRILGRFFIKSMPEK